MIIGAIIATIFITLGAASSYFFYREGYKRGDWDVHTRLMSVARFGAGEYTVNAPGFIAVYKLKELKTKKG